MKQIGDPGSDSALKLGSQGSGIRNQLFAGRATASWHESQHRFPRQHVRLAGGNARDLMLVIFIGCQRKPLLKLRYVLNPVETMGAAKRRVAVGGQDRQQQLGLCLGHAPARAAIGRGFTCAFPFPSGIEPAGEHVTSAPAPALGRRSRDRRPG